VNNTDIDVASDTLHPAPPIHMEIALPGWLDAKNVVAHVLTPDGANVKAAVHEAGERAVTIELSGVQRYASVVLNRKM
jgi:hypothetical protein